MRRIAAAVLAGTAGVIQAQELLAPLPTAGERGVQVLGVLALVSLALAFAAAVHLKPRDVRAGLASIWAGVVMLACVVAFACVYLLVRPGNGYEGLLAFLVLYYGAIPFALAVLAMWSSIWNGNATRFRVFAAWLGILTAASIAIYFIAVRA